MKAIITGGIDYVGQNLSLALLKRGFEILIIDSFPVPDQFLNLKGLSFCKYDFLAEDKLNDIFEKFKPDLVFHLSDWGKLSSSMLDKRCEEFHIKSTDEIIKSCHKNNISKLIYYSSYNVIFNGEEISLGNETLPLTPTSNSLDYYSSGKKAAEEMVIKANGSTLQNGNVMLTAAVRPAVVYGEGEPHLLPRIVKCIDSGLMNGKVADATGDWIYISNLITGLLLLTEKLLLVSSDASQAPAGQVYFLSDGSPIEFFEFLRPLIAARRKPFPSFNVSQRAALFLAYLAEMIFIISTYIGFPFEPILTRRELLQISSTHFFSIQKAGKELGFKSGLNSYDGAEKIAKYYSKRLSNEEYFEFSPLKWWVFSFCYVSILWVLALSTQSKIAIVSIFKNIFKNQYVVNLLDDYSNFIFSILLYASLCIYIIEGFYAFYITKFQLKCSKTWHWWTIQTLFVGLPSILSMQKRVIMKL